MITDLKSVCHSMITSSTSNTVFKIDSDTYIAIGMLVWLAMCHFLKKKDIYCNCLCIVDSYCEALNKLLGIKIINVFESLYTVKRYFDVRNRALKLQII